MASFEQFEIFSRDNLGSVRTTFKEETGEVWFVLSDVCRILGLSNPSKTADGVDEEDKMTLTNSYSHSGERGGAQKLIIINESGLYGVIFKSRKPEAKVFKRWVTSEVLPSIRKNGSYFLAHGSDEIANLKKEVEDLTRKLEELTVEKSEIVQEYRELFEKHHHFDTKDMVVTNEGFVMSRDLFEALQ